MTNLRNNNEFIATFCVPNETIYVRGFEKQKGGIYVGNIGDLVLRAQTKDQEAFRTLYETVYKELYQLAYYTLQNSYDAEDVVADTILTAYESIGKLKNPESFKSWITKITMNKCRRKIRNYMRREAELLDEVSIQETDVALRSDIKHALYTLSFEERQIVVLHLLCGYKGEEVSQILNIKHTTIRSKYRRSLEKLKKELQW